jgi:hypothetical protein
MDFSIRLIFSNSRHFSIRLIFSKSRDFSIRLIFSGCPASSQIHKVSDWGDKVDSGIGYVPARQATL